MRRPARLILRANLKKCHLPLRIAHIRSVKNWNFCHLIYNNKWIKFQWRTQPWRAKTFTKMALPTCIRSRSNQTIFSRIGPKSCNQAWSRVKTSDQWVLLSIFRSNLLLKISSNTFKYNHIKCNRFNCKDSIKRIRHQASKNCLRLCHKVWSTKLWSKMMQFTLQNNHI